MARNGTRTAAAHGARARRPQEIPASGWRDIAFRAKDQVSKDNIGLVAAGVAFYALLALFPAIAALVSIYGLIADPQTVTQHVAMLEGIVPQQALDIIRGQLDSVASGSSGKLGFGLVFGILLSLWSATKGMNAVITALNIAYDEEEKRGFIKLTLLALAFTLGAILVVIVALAGVVAVPAILGTLGLGAAWEWLVSIARWPVLATVLVIAIAVLYRFGPNREWARWEWVSWGAVVATLLWLLGSIGFSIYVRNFNSYNETYGSLGAVIVLLMWFYLSAYAMLVGAELNAEMERQTRRDTTTPPDQPIGRRGAYAADHKAEPGR